MTIIVETCPITGGVDTHLDVHVAAALDVNGGVLGVASFPTTAVGFAELYGWLCEFGTLARVGVEGTPAPMEPVWPASCAPLGRGDRGRSLQPSGPCRHGKCDTVDAVDAARSALSGRAQGVAKTADGNVEAIRVLLVAFRSGEPVKFSV